LPITTEQKYDVDAMKERLYSYRESDKEIDEQIERLERLVSKMSRPGATALSDMPKNHSASTDRMADMVSRKEELESCIKVAIRKRDSERKSIESMLKKLKRADERSVIRMRYFDGVGWNDVNRMMFGRKDDFDEREDSYLRRVHHLHSNAIIHLAMIEACNHHVQKRNRR